MNAHEQLQVILQEDIHQLGLLVELLNQEKTVLASADIQPLQDITSQKNQILEGVRERARKKIHLLVDIGYRPNAGDPSRFIRAAGMG